MPERQRSEETRAAGACDRRSFAKLAGAVAAGAALSPGWASLAPGGEAAAQDAQPRVGLPTNDLAPALQFQADPGGTGVAWDAWSEDPTASSKTIAPVPWSGPVPSDAAAIAFLPVHRQAALIRAGHLSSSRLTEIYLERLERLDPRLFCVVTLMKDQARAEAARADAEIKAGKLRGPLHGIPYGVKDLFSTKGAPTSWGAKPFEGRIIDEDAAVVEKLRAAGAVLVAKLTTGTFARGDRWFRGVTRNPWNTRQGSSGSSAGPASAVAAGCVGFAIGTETLGSIISPSRRCGISALRPTFGRVSRHGGMTLAWSMDKVGPMGRSIEDCVYVFEAIQGADARDPSTVSAPFHWRRSPDLSALRIGYAEGADPGFLEALRGLGAKPRKIGRRPSNRAWRVIIGVESAAAFDDFLSAGLDAGMVHKDRVKGFRQGRSISGADYLHAQRRRLELMRAMGLFMKDLDLYVSMDGDLGTTNLTGHPSAIFPYTFLGGQPRCIQLVGKLYSDDLIMSVAHTYQSTTDWHSRRPPL